MRDVKVLFPLDGSRVSYEAMVGAIRMLKDVPGVRFTALNVTAGGMEHAPEDLVRQTDQDEEDEIFPTEASSRRALDRAVVLARAEGASLETVIRKGNAAQAILKEAAGCDLLVLHELSRSSFRDLVRLSASEKLVRKAPCSVLLVRTRPAKA